MTNTELIKKLDPSEGFIKNKYAREYRIPELDKTLSIEDIFYLYKDDKLDVSLLERTEDDRLENIDDRLFSNFKFTQNTREGIDSLIRCFVSDDNIAKEMKMFPLSTDELLELTINGEVLLKDKLPFGGSTNFYLKLKIKDKRRL